MAPNQPNGLREQVRQLGVEVASLRQTRHEHSDFLTRHELRLDQIREDQKAIAEDVRTNRLDIANLRDQMANLVVQSGGWSKRDIYTLVGIVVTAIFGLAVALVRGG